jgi:putative Mn2+ efflux pump MntP
MTIYSILVIALALSLDAFGVAISIGLNNRVGTRNKMAFILSFGFFQFFLSFIGAYSGFLFNIYVIAIPKIIGGVVISIVGVMMIKEGMEKKDEKLLLRKRMYFILGISVSIDAAVVGFTALNRIGSIAPLLRSTLFIGVITLIMSTIAFIISKYLKEIDLVGKYADYIGGVILIIFGLKMMFF